MTAKKFVKGTSRAKVNIIFQTLCCYLRKEKSPSKLKALQYHQHSEQHHMLRMPEDAVQLVYNEKRNISERKMMFPLLPLQYDKTLNTQLKFSLKLPKNT